MMVTSPGQMRLRMGTMIDHRVTRQQCARLPTVTEYCLRLMNGPRYRPDAVSSYPPSRMNNPRRLQFACFAATVLLAIPAAALDGQTGIHDPATVTAFNGRYYTWGTGNGMPGLVSDDGWTWQQGTPLMSGLPGGKAGPAVLARGGNNTWAPDVIHVGDKVFVYYSAPAQQPRSAVGLLVGRSLDPQSPEYGWTDGGPVVWSDGVEDSNAIDPGVLLDRTDGRMWLTYGSYFGYIRLVELDPKTGQRRYPDRPAIDVAINSEASILIQHDDWYYLLVTHGSCCAGANSTYNIRVGRSRKVTGPYLDNMGIDMLEGGGKLFAGSRGRHIGPGHFGLLDLGDGVQKFSLHYEADLDRGGSSVLDIRPLLWHDGWPVAGDNLQAGTYSLESARTGTVLELRCRASRLGVRGVVAAGADHPARVVPAVAVAVLLVAAPVAPRVAQFRPRLRIRMPRRYRQTGRLAPSMCVSHHPCCRPSRNGRSRRHRAAAAIQVRRTSASALPVPSACWRPRQAVN
jgi:hypothetical protein